MAPVLYVAVAYSGFRVTVNGYVYFQSLTFTDTVSINNKLTEWKRKINVNVSSVAVSSGICLHSADVGTVPILFVFIYKLHL